jgi:enoyl-CoA hydratase/carnithine racemase
MGPADAILVGFADMFIPQEKWPGLIDTLVDIGDPACLVGEDAPEGTLAALRPEIDAHFAATTLPGLLANLRGDAGEFAQKTLKTVLRNSPLSVAVTIEMMTRLRGVTDIRTALDLEYRFTSRAMEHGDFIEGIRAAIIDKDRSPQWKHQADTLPPEAIDTMLAPLGDNALTF